MKNGKSLFDKMKPIIVPDELQKDGIDWAFLGNVKSVAERCFKNPRYEEVYRLHNTWDNHVNNILGYIADFCTKSGLVLNMDESTIVIAASILHDIGKSLPYLHPLIDQNKIFEEDFVLKNLEGAHHVITFIVLKQIVKNKPLQNLIKENEKQEKCCAELNELIGIVKDNEKWQKYLLCVAWISLRHKTLDGRLLYIFKPNLKVYLENPPNSINGGEYDKKAPDFFDKENAEIKELNNFFEPNQEKGCHDRFSVLSALLQLGDKLDISQKRIRLSRFYLEVLLDDITDKDVMRDNLLPPKSLILWYRFYYTGEPIIEAITEGDSKTNPKKTGVKITIPYTYPESMRNDFLYFRYKSEKDFEDLAILSTLEGSLQFEKNNEDYHIILERTENKKDGPTPVRIIGLENRNERLIYCLRQMCAASKKELNFDEVRNKINKVLEKKIGPIPCMKNITQSNIMILKISKSLGRPANNFIKSKLRFMPSRVYKKMPLYFVQTHSKKLIASGYSSKVKTQWRKSFPHNAVMQLKTQVFTKKTSTYGIDSSKECPLVQKIIEIYNNDIQKPSHPDWEKYSFKLPGNIRQLICWKSKISTDKNKIQEYLRDLENEQVMLSFSRQAKEGMKQWKADAADERKKLSAGTLFYPKLNSPQFTSNINTRRIPASLDIAFLLNLFRHLKEESLNIDDIANISGLDRGRIQKYCGWLEHESFLLLDDKAETYKINFDPAKYSVVEKVLKDFDTRRSEMVSKIRDIDRFGKPLALYSERSDHRIKTNIKGLDQIISPFDDKLQGLPLRKSILLVGPPGSGKTTLALDIVRQVRLQRLPEEVALYLTFAGDIQRLADDYASLGWEYRDIAACVRSLSTLQSKTYLNDPDKFFKHLLNILDEFSPDLVAIDNLGYFLRLVPAEFSREIFNRLIKVLTVRGITSILIGDDIANGIGFELFDTDGVIYLHYKDGKREIEITKMRGREFAGSKHPFKIKSHSGTGEKKSNESNKPIIEVYPNIQMHLDIAQREITETVKKQGPDNKNNNEKNGNNIKQALKSGIKGLDELLPVYIDGKGKDSGFEQGEMILVLGSPGGGKTVSGLHFLAEGDKNKEKVLWISFESDLDGLQLATRSFTEETGVKKFVKKIKENMDNQEAKDKETMFRFFPPAQLDPNELVNFLLEACHKNGQNKDEKILQRIVIDSVNDIEQAFPTDMAFKTFMTSLVQLLREEKVTVMFLYRTRNFFGKSEDIGRTLASVVDTIICLKVLEIQNAVQKGLFLLKVRGREHKSRLLSVDFKEKEGMSVIDRGWTLSGLISGEAGEIKEPRVSVKLFFENRNEFLINALIVSEYNRRFKGGQTTFVHVRKPQIYSEFWSFKGSSGAGHSNVRVVSLCDYWASSFYMQEKLYDLSDYVSPAIRQFVYREEFWRRCAGYSFKKHSFEIFSIPNYVDIGVLAFHRKLTGLKKFWGAVKFALPKTVEDARKKLAGLTWNMLDPRINPGIKAVVDKSKRNKLKYLFAMPNLLSIPSFVSFFLEVYWSFGGVIFDLRQLFSDYAEYCYDDKDKNVKEKIFFTSSEIRLTPNMQFIAEILMLIPERILNNVIRFMNGNYPNFLGDICRHGEVLLEKFLKKDIQGESEKTSLNQIAKRSGITDIDNPGKAFFESYSLENSKNTEDDPIIAFIDKLHKELNKDDIWYSEPKGKDLLSALEKIKDNVITIMDIKEMNTEKEHFLIILYFVISRIISNRERYQKLLEWYLKRKKIEEFEEIKSNPTMNRYSYLSDIIQIGNIPEQDSDQDAEDPGQTSKADKKESADIKTFEFLFQMVKEGIAPNPHRGDFTDRAYLIRKWSGDVAPRPKLPETEDLIKILDLRMPPDAYEYRKDDNDKTNYDIAPLPSYEKNNKKFGYAVMGLWSLGITRPALSPEIGWIFIDALTEDRFVRLRSRKGLGLPAKVSVYQRESLQKEQPDIYGVPDKNGIPKGGIVQAYELATRDKAIESDPGNNQDDNVRRIRERASIPYYYQIEEFLIKELSRFFEPSFFAILAKKDDDGRQKLIADVLTRIHNRIKNFLIKEFELDENDK